MRRSLPVDVRQRPLDEQRIITSLSLLLHSAIVTLSIFVACYSWIDWRQALLCLPPAALCALGLVALRRGNTTMTMHGVLLVLLIMLDVFTLTTGGPDSPTPMWYALIPLLAMALLPMRVGVTWSAIMIVHQLALLLCFFLGAYSWRFVPSGRTGFHEFMVGFVTAPVVAGVFAFWAAKARDQLAAKLRKAKTVLQMVLDEVPTGFLIVDRDCRLTQSPSMGDVVVSRPAEKGESLLQLLCSAHLERGARFGVAFDALVEEILPVELLLEQMPQHWRFNGRELSVRYHLVYDNPGERWTRLALTVDDVTDDIARSRIEEQRDAFARIVHLLQTERDAFLDFVQESDRIVAVLRANHGDDGWLRALHTLKGTAGVFGLGALSQACHDAEQLALAGSRQGALRMVDDAWKQWRACFEELTEHGGFDGIRVEQRTVRAFEDAVNGGVSYEELLQTLHQWTELPVHRALERAGGRATAVAERLGKPAPIVVVECEELRVDAERWRPLWSAMIHLIRNAVDHGFEGADERGRGLSAKPGRLTLRASIREQHLVIEVGDDGRGIDWKAVKKRAGELGLNTDAEHSVDWLLTEGLSTRAIADEISGRGVGLAAVAEAVGALEGELDVVSKRNRGTTWRIMIPVRNMRGKSDGRQRRSAAMVAIAG